MVTVSVIIPAFNAEKFIIKTIESVLDQTFKDFEILIINDGSTDKTSEIVKSTYHLESRVKVCDLVVNAGVANARNVGVRKAVGKFISFCDSDDTWRQDKLDLQLQLFSNLAIGVRDKLLIGSNVDEIDANGNLLKSRKTIDVTTVEQIFTRNYLTLSSIFCLKSSLEEFPFRNIKHEDYDLWIRMIGNGYSFICHPAALTYYRIHDRSLSSNKLKSVVWHIQAQRFNNVPILAVIKHLFLNFKSRISK